VKKRVIILSLIGILGIAIAGIQGYRVYRRSIPPPNYIPRQALKQLESSTGRDQCSDRKYCIVVYVTPWCSECHLQADVIRAAHRELKQDPDFGLAVIIGGDTKLELQLMANELGVPALFDPDGHYRDQAGIRSFPKWLIIEQSGAVLERFTRMPWFNRDAPKEELATRLKQLLIPTNYSSSPLAPP